MMDINYIGHICFDEVFHPDGRRARNVGGAAVYGIVEAKLLTGTDDLKRMNQEH